MFKGLGNFGEQEVGNVKQFVLMRTGSYEIVQKFLTSVYSVQGNSFYQYKIFCAAIIA